MKNAGLLAATLLAATAGATIPNLNWDLELGASISGNTLTIQQRAGQDRCLAWAYVDISQRLGDDTGACFTFRLRGENVQPQASGSYGAKAMVIVPTTSGLQYLQTKMPTGTFGWTNVSVHVSSLRAVPTNGVVRLCLGVQKSEGTVVFDLSALTVETESLGIERVNQDYIVRYPPSAPGPLRGFNSPTRATTEADMRDMRALGARLVRFQMIRNWFAVDDNQDLPEFWAWLDTRLDNLADVLGWAKALGMKVAVDLHVVPGGRNADREENLYNDARWLDAFVETWRRIATRCAPIVQTMGPVIYGYDLINEPTQRSPATVASYWEAQRRAAEAIRAIDPDTAIIVESCAAASAGAFRYLSPLAMDNVIYQFHLYTPLEFTHQGVNSYVMLPNTPWPSPARGWDADALRTAVRRVREFQLNHKCRIFVGEFAAAAWAVGADRWLRDCIDIFEDYGWDWAYHAFRASYEWDIEREGPAATNMTRVAMTPRKATLIDAMLYAPDNSWFSSVATNGATATTGGAWLAEPGAAATFSALGGREGVARILAELAPAEGCLPGDLDDILETAKAGRDLAAVAFVDEGDDGPLTLRCLVADDAGAPIWRTLDGFTAERCAPCRVVSEIGCTGGVARVRYAAEVMQGTASAVSLFRLRSTIGETWFPAPAAAFLAGRVAVSDRPALSALVGTASSAESIGNLFTLGTVAEISAANGTSGTVTVELRDPIPGIPDDYLLRLTLHAARSPSSGGDVLCVIDRPYAGAGTYLFDTAGCLAAEAFAGGILYHYEVALVDPSGDVVSPAVAGTLRIACEDPWFSTDAATGSVNGGRWVAGGTPALRQGVWQVRPRVPGRFSATSGRGGMPRVEATLPRFGSHLECDLPDLLAEAVANGDRAALVPVEEDDNSITFRGLALANGAPAWIKLDGAVLSDDTCRFVAEFDLSGDTPMVSYLAGGGLGDASAAPLTRLRSPSGAVWLPATGGAINTLAGQVAISGTADLSSLIGTVGLTAAEAETAETRRRRTTFLLVQ